MKIETKKIVKEILLISVFFLGLDFVVNYTNTQSRHIKIKKVTLSLKKFDRYLVFTKDNGVLGNTDLLFIGKFNSIDLQNKMLGQKECEVITKGYRMRFISSSYPNIVEVINCK